MKKHLDGGHITGGIRAPPDEIAVNTISPSHIFATLRILSRRKKDEGLKELEDLQLIPAIYRAEGCMAIMEGH